MLLPELEASGLGRLRQKSASIYSASKGYRCCARYNRVPSGLIARKSKTSLEPFLLGVRNHGNRVARFVGHPRISATAGEPKRRVRVVMSAALIVLFIVIKSQALVPNILEQLVP